MTRSTVSTLARLMLSSILVVGCGKTRSADVTNRTLSSPQPNSTGSLVAASDDKVLWRAPVPAQGLRQGIALSPDAVYLTAGPRVLVLDPASGRPIGAFQNPSLEALSIPTALADDLAVVTDSRFVFAIDRTGRELWRYAFGAGAIGWEQIANQPCVITSNGTILAAGPDGYVHAVSRDGHGLWRTAVGVYGQGRPALAIGTTDDLLLLDTRLSPAEPPSLVGIDLHNETKRIRFANNLGIDVSGLVAGAQSGIVATSYAETKSRRGASVIASLNHDGTRRWLVERGRHERVHGVLRSGQLVAVSESADAEEAATTLDIWSPLGRLEHSQALDAHVVSVLVGSDDVLYVVGCRERSTSLRTFRADLTPAAPLDVRADCPLMATLDEQGRMFLMGTEAHVSGGESFVNLTVVRTPSPSAAATWSVPRARPTGSGAFSLPM